MSANFRHHFFSAIFLGIFLFIAAVPCNAQNTIAPIATPPALIFQRKAFPPLTPAIAIKRDLQTGKITGYGLAEMPVIVSGEIEGSVYENFKPQDDKPLGGARIKIRHNDPNDTSEVKLTEDLLTFSNGQFYYTYTGIVPGKYRAYIDPKQLNLLHYTCTPPYIDFVLENKEIGDTKDGLNFTLKSGAVLNTVASPANALKVFPQQILDVYDHGDPTAEEQYELELINRARANPTAEGILLFNTTDPYLLQNLSFYKTPTPSQVKSDFATYPAQPPLAFNKDIIAAARRHSQDMLTNNYQAHNSPTDGSTPFTRMQDAGYAAYDFAGENIFAYGNDLDEINQEFEYDFGNSPTGHRENLINYAGYVYSEIGLGILYGGTGSPNVGPIITTEDFGHVPGNIFITGVVYGDDNHNNFYDVGEGLSGVTITVSGGSTSAVSSTSGGYAIPFTDAGTVTVTASGGLLTSPISHQVTLSTENVKVDFVQGSTGFPAQAILISPISDTIINTDTAHFSWNAVSGATKYRIQVATDPLMKKLILNDSSLTSAKRILPGLKDTTKYYWRVQAKNTIGWGQYSPIVSFIVGLPLNPVVLVSPANKSNTGSNDITLIWDNTNPTANDYWVEVSASPLMTNPIHSDTLIYYPDTTVTYSAADFNSSATYYWEVRAENENGFNASSAVRSFTTGISSVSSPIAGSTHSTVSPNPTSGETHIRFSLESTADVSMKVFGLTGIEESNMNLGKLSPNSYDIIWSGIDKPAGIYLYELSIGDRHDIGRIILVK